MDEQLHIIIAGNKGRVFKLPCTRGRLCFIVTVSTISLIILTITSICSFTLYSKNRQISSQLAGLQQNLLSQTEQIAQYNRLTEEQRLKLDLNLARLELVKQANDFKQEKETLISTAIDQLNERSELIEKVIGNIGIQLPEVGSEDPNHSGGPFIPHPDSAKDQVLYKADRYLEIIRYLPIGKPVAGTISSRYGKRRDPMNRQSAFHTGVDIRSDKGAPVYATAAGVVKKAFRNGGYGNYVLIDHGNGYTTSFAHLQKYVVHKGQKVKRGQLIGRVGNTGRSTGPHLHYEIALENRSVNPYKFMKLASVPKVHPPASESK